MFKRNILSIIFLIITVSCFAKGDKWGKIDYSGPSWTKNISKPLKIKKGLDGRHLCVWASHGRYFDTKTNQWKWQRPNLFCTNEDLFTQTIVVPYLIPMLERSGAVVFTPRERDWSLEEVVIDNDTPSIQGGSGSDLKRNADAYSETNGSKPWFSTSTKGFLIQGRVYTDGENPFANGSARMAKTTTGSNISTAIYKPNFKEEGPKAVYVSYQTFEQSSDEVHYTVIHKGVATEITVNQRMGGGTWVYLGTFDFDEGCNDFNKVIVSNRTSHSGIVTTDAVRFGGGMGNIDRGHGVSGMPRALEGARYMAQYSGAPYSVYSSKHGKDDYSDDINVRSFMENYLAGGSIYAPGKEGLYVPIELSLAVHSDAGYAKDGNSLIGSLAICTTDANDGKLGAGNSRSMSKEFAQALLNNINNDLQKSHGRWNVRTLYDKNYSETRCPLMPSAIIETLSHQNFPDMMLAQDPNFRFTLARAIYKTCLRFITEKHNESYIVAPLPPKDLMVKLKTGGKAVISWDAQKDKLENSASPSGYILYTAYGDGDWDNGTAVSKNSVKIKLERGMRYRFKVTAVNKGGESMDSEPVVALFNSDFADKVLLVDAFNRLSSPAIVKNDYSQGFLLDDDMGVTDGLTLGWVGRQVAFDTGKMGMETTDGLGYSTNELSGKPIMGNNHIATTEILRNLERCGKYNVESCNSGCIDNKDVELYNYKAIIYLLGLQRNTPFALKGYPTFTKNITQQLTAYLHTGGNLLLSGAYMMRDSNASGSYSFIKNTLGINIEASSSRKEINTANNNSQTFKLNTQPNAKHYHLQSCETIVPLSSNNFTSLLYSTGESAAIAGNCRQGKIYVMGFPIESITDNSSRTTLLKSIMNYFQSK